MSICSKGKISHVASGSKKCITDKRQKLIIIPKYDVGLLSNYGYTLHAKYDDRIKSIKKSLKEHSKLKILKHINALKTLQKSNKIYYNKLSRDLKWIQSNYNNL